MIAVAGILMHDVGKIGGGDIEPLRQKPRDQQRHRRLLAQKRSGVVEFVDVESAAARTVAVCGLSSSTDISPNTAPGSADAGDDGVALDDFEPALDQDEQMPGTRRPHGERACPRARFA